MDDDSVQWWERVVHWHCYSEHGSVFAPHAVAAERLERPGRVLLSPVQVADWVRGQQKSHARRCEVRLLGDRSRWAAVGDEGHRLRDHRDNVAVLERGDSLLTDFPAERGGRVYLFAYARSVEDRCPCRGR